MRSVSKAKALRFELLNEPGKLFTEHPSRTLKKQLVAAYTAGRQALYEANRQARNAAAAGKPAENPAGAETPEQVSPGVLRGPDGKLYTNIPLGPVA